MPNLAQKRSSVSRSLHMSTAAGEGPDRLFAPPSIFLCLTSVVADIYSRHMHVNDVASQRTLGLYCPSEVPDACVFAALAVLAGAILRLQLYYICCSTPPPLTTFGVRKTPDASRI